MNNYKPSSRRPASSLDEGLLSNLRVARPPDPLNRPGESRLTAQVGVRATCPEPPACPVFPESNTSTNPRFLFLREVGVDCLRSFLENVAIVGPTGPHWGGTLIIDREVTIDTPIRIPAAFTLAGVGIHGAGRIRFKGPFTGEFKGRPAISFQENIPSTKDKEAVLFGGKSIIRDIAIESLGATRGIKVGSQRKAIDALPFGESVIGRFQLHRVLVSGFSEFGIQGGMSTYTVLLDECEVFDNGVNIQLIFQCNSWRIRDCIISRATSWGIDIGAEIVVDGLLQPGSVSDSLIFGCRFHDNQPGAIRIQPGHNLSKGEKETPDDVPNVPIVNTTTGIMVVGNHFEGNQTAVKIDDAKVNGGLVSPLSANRIISNFFGGSEAVVVPKAEAEIISEPNAPNLENMSLMTQIGFNATRNNDSTLNTLRAKGTDAP